jgi:hypothetical protein
MHTQTHVATSRTPALIANVLGVTAALVLLAMLTNLHLLVASTDAMAFTALVLIGVAMCAVAGISRAPAMLGWTHPVTLSGVVLGIAILGLILANAFGWIAGLEPVASAIGISVERAAVLLLAVLLAAKWAIGLAFVHEPEHASAGR